MRTPIWPEQEREALERTQRLLRTQPDGGVVLLRETVAALSVSEASARLNQYRSCCAAVFGNLSASAGNLARTLPRTGPLFRGSGGQNARSFGIYCKMAREAEEGGRELNRLACALSVMERADSEQRIPAFLQAERLCLAAMALAGPSEAVPLMPAANAFPAAKPAQEPAAPEPSKAESVPPDKAACLTGSAEEGGRLYAGHAPDAGEGDAALIAAAKLALRALSGQKREAEALARKLRESRETLEAFCRENLPAFCSRAAALADAEHKGGHMQCASLSALCGAFVHHTGELAKRFAEPVF